MDSSRFGVHFDQPSCAGNAYANLVPVVREAVAYKGMTYISPDPQAVFGNVTVASLVTNGICHATAGSIWGAPVDTMPSWPVRIGFLE